MRVSRLGAATQPPAYAVLWQHAFRPHRPAPRSSTRTGSGRSLGAAPRIYPLASARSASASSRCGPARAPHPQPHSQPHGLPTPPFSFVPPAHSLPLPRSLLSLPSARRASACCRSEHVKTPVAEGQRHAAYERVECAPVFPSVSSLLSDLPLTSSQASLVSLPYKLPYKVTKPHAWGPNSACTCTHMHMHLHMHTSVESPYTLESRGLPTNNHATL